ncbi:NAD(P)-binding domain-containing protein [Amaricoccus tamworthensis]|uniref:pyrroline-5-carboxylate reductase family protein n=1 Tax=Amaricoccus tamworthensis TaxID=57002 RepID=UPI003C7CFA63
MTADPWTLGIIGGTGMLGYAIAHAILKARTIPPDRLWISNRSGRADGFDDHPDITLTTNNQDLAQGCDVILLSVPPAMADRAVRQLFLSAGTMMANAQPTPAEHVQQMIDYAGTTAAGLEDMRRSTIAQDIAKGLDAAIARTRTIGSS